MDKNKSSIFEKTSKEAPKLNPIIYRVSCCEALICTWALGTDRNIFLFLLLVIEVPTRHERRRKKYCLLSSCLHELESTEHGKVHG